MSDVRHLTANLPVSDVAAATTTLESLLGLEPRMDLGWIRTLGGPGGQVSLVEAGAHGPALSVGVEDVDAIHARAQELGLAVSYALRDEPWGVRRFMFDLPGGTTVNVVAHR